MQLIETVPGLMLLPSLRRMQIMPNKYPAEQPQRVIRMALERLVKYGST